jgi:hypothetical protein
MMAKKEVTPGALCKIIGSVDGPNGKSVGRQCRAVERHQQEHVLHGPIWLCESVDGADFVTQYGALGSRAHFAEDWLLVLDEDPNALPRITEKELEHG